MGEIHHQRAECVQMETDQDFSWRAVGVGVAGGSGVQMPENPCGQAVPYRHSWQQAKQPQWTHSGQEEHSHPMGG